jgi:hypothetical protein
MSPSDRVAHICQELEATPSPIPGWAGLGDPLVWIERDRSGAWVFDFDMT